MTLTAESVLDEVRHRLGPLNDQAEQAVAEALAIIQQAPKSAFASQLEESFQGETAELQEYLSWPEEKQERYHDEAERVNAKWMEKKLRELKAMWLIVDDSQVLAHGPVLRTFPHDRDFEVLCKKLGKYPFVFFSPRMFYIEEAMAWHTTEIPGDAYPALLMTLKSDNRPHNIEADFDTGAVDVFLDLDSLTDAGIFTTSSQDVKRTSSHLEQRYSFITKSVALEIKDQKGRGHEITTRAICVKNRRNSPFVAVNPDRNALVGRDLLLQLRLQVLLDFAARQTQVEDR